MLKIDIDESDWTDLQIAETRELMEYRGIRVERFDASLIITNSCRQLRDSMSNILHKLVKVMERNPNTFVSDDDSIDMRKNDFDQRF